MPTSLTQAAPAGSQPHQPGLLPQPFHVGDIVTRNEFSDGMADEELGGPLDHGALGVVAATADLGERALVQVGMGSVAAMS